MGCDSSWRPTSMREAWMRLALGVLLGTCDRGGAPAEHTRAPSDAASAAPLASAPSSASVAAPDPSGSASPEAPSASAAAIDADAGAPFRPCQPFPASRPKDLVV